MIQLCLSATLSVAGSSTMRSGQLPATPSLRRLRPACLSSTSTARVSNVMARDGGRRYEIHWLPGAPSGENYEILQELTANAA
jgi:hypothetical protein